MEPNLTISPEDANHNAKRIARAMRQMMQYLDIHSRQLLKKQDITVPQVMCMDELKERGPLNVAQLAEAVHLSPSTTVGIIDRLERKNFVTRTRSDIDRRSVFVEITHAGRHFVVDTPQLLHNRLKVAMASLTQDRQKHIADAFEGLVPLLQKDLREQSEHE